MGKVFLVGAGPGAPGLITVKGREVLNQADVILFDRLVQPYLLEYAPQAKKIYCGKKTERHTWNQNEINHILIKEAKAGKTVVRLKGGDPFIFGRGGEEALALSMAKIPFEIIPGVSSSIGGPAFCGVPLTHRGISSNLVIVTGRQDPSGPSNIIDWKKIAALDTIVILMGVKELPHIVENIRKIRSIKTPVKIISWGTYAKQKIIKGTLKDIVFKSQKSNIKPPSVIIIGDVVNVPERYESFQNFQSQGIRTLLIDSQNSSSEIGRKLLDLGFYIEEFFYKKEISKRLLLIIDNLKNYRWIVFSDNEAIVGFTDALRLKGIDIRDINKINLGVIGEKTRNSLLEKGMFAKRIFNNRTKLPDRSLLVNSDSSKISENVVNNVCAFNIEPVCASDYQKLQNVYGATFILSPSGMKWLSSVKKLEDLGLIYAVSDCEYNNWKIYREKIIYFESIEEIEKIIDSTFTRTGFENNIIDRVI